jgi:hypothetical protein
MMDEKLGGQFVNNERFHVPRLLSIINFFCCNNEKKFKTTKIKKFNQEPNF